MNQQEFLSCKRKAVKQFFNGMNSQQLEAVTTVGGSVLVLAGAGSGKTTVIVNRIAYMMLFGDTLNTFTAIPGDAELGRLNAYAQGTFSIPSEELQSLIAASPVKPWNILAITFTNKAANELKERLALKLGDAAQDIHASTFHSACVRILRTCIDCMGYSRDFTIYDTDDCQNVMKDCIKALNLNEKNFKFQNVLADISQAKDKMIAPSDYTHEFGSDYKQTTHAKLYQAYQDRLKTANAVDFDDLIYLTVRIFENYPDILEKYQDRYRYIMVDEYQDTNHAQYRLVSLLAKKYGNLCVVGDDDQSIYSFRGAVIDNILSFGDEYADCKTIRLEKNYRSTQNILNAANSVIAKNTIRKEKTLWTSAGDGEQVSVVKNVNETKESDFIADVIQKGIISGKHYSDFAVLYRANALSNNVEKALVKNHIPYRIYGGLRFQDRKEVKDVTAYLCILQNPFDLVRFERIINTPTRGIGDATVEAVTQTACAMNISLLETMERCQEFPALAKRANALLAFSDLINELRQLLDVLPLDEFFDVLLEKTGYQEMLKSDENAEERLQNVKEFRSNIVDYIGKTENPTLEGFLSEMALYTDADKNLMENNVVSLMSMHSAKGLEFDTVFAVGMEDKVFPSYRSLNNPENMEEERRLAYVTITRAKQKLYLLHVQDRLLYGFHQKNQLSRFAREISNQYVSIDDRTVSSATMPSKSPVVSGARSQMAAIQKKTKPSDGNPVLMLHVNDRVHDKVFGDGTILRAEPMGNDCLLEIAFDTIGTKKLMARYRQIIKI